MRQILSRLLVGLLIAAVLAGPVWADVIPTQYASPSGSQAKVEARLSELGFAPAEARLRAERLTDDQAAYFAHDPERLQLVGQEMWGGQSDNLWWEWVFGIAALVGVGFGIYIFAESND
jgi:hypothetical protein